MMHEDVKEKLAGILLKMKPETDLSLVNEDTRIIDELGMDSLTLLMMALQAEKTFGIRFENLQASSFQTVGDICRYIEGKL